jgi:hypothetical protein
MRAVLRELLRRQHPTIPRPRRNGSGGTPMGNDIREDHYLHPGGQRPARTVLTPAQARRIRQHPSHTTGSTDPPASHTGSGAAASAARG